MLKLIFSFVFFVVILLHPLSTFASHTSDPTVSLLQSRISNNFSKKFCNAIQNGLSKDEAMTSAIIKTENIVSFFYNPQKKFIEKEDLANQISIKVINNCGWNFGLMGKEGIDYFKSYFLEIYDKTTPNKKLTS
ncbi:possible ATP synthase protein 8 [Prochlorococcus marinus str. MIT 9515]|uniref:Possible ATP synthase protein 8 n=1 Tax=Prochlorococcus marinus (strain MIT 9515) TaxID=167542 RepID=A2BWV5_PROM5|nr:possible ATP synthase protein 8 [Prochlorococcus marinus str. MIT 9515]